MKLTLVEPKYLKESINIISELVSEGRFKITNNGVELVAMDPANVAMVVFKLLSSCFVEYKIEKDTDLCINLQNLKQVLKRAKPNDALTLELGSDSKLNVILKGASTRKFSLSILDLEDKEQKIPDLTFPVIVSTSTDTLNDAIEDVSVVGESATFVCEPDKFVVRGEGDFSKASIEVPASERTEISNDSSDPVRSKYSIEYLKKMILGSKLTDKVTILFDRDYPLKLDYKEVDKVQLSFILAPRVENN